MKIKPNKIFQRDRWACALCGAIRTDGSLVPHHRANRGMGGNPKADQPSNILSLCSRCNELLEQDAPLARRARRYGIKISSFFVGGAHLIPVKVCVPGTDFRVWMALDNDYGIAPAGDEHKHQISLLEGGY